MTRVALGLIVLFLLIFMPVLSPQSSGQVSYQDTQIQMRWMSIEYVGDDFLVSDWNNYEVGIWNTSTESYTWTYLIGQYPIDAIKLSNGNYLISNYSYGDHAVQEVTHSKQVVWSYSHWNKTFKDIHELPNGHITAYIQPDNGAYDWCFGEYVRTSNPDNITAVWELCVPDTYIGGVAKIEDDRWLYTNNHNTDEAVHIENDSWRLGGFSNPTEAILIDPDTVVVADQDKGRIVFINTTSKEIEDIITFNDSPRALGLNPEGNKLVVVGIDDNTLYEIRLDAYPRNLTATDGINDDGSYLRVEWDAPPPTMDFIDYKVYLEGSLVGSTTNPWWNLTTLTAGDHNLKVGASYRNKTWTSNTSITATTYDEMPVMPTFQVGNITDTLLYVDVAPSSSSDAQTYHIYIENASFTSTDILTSSLTPAASSASPGNQTFTRTEPGTYHIAVTVEDGSNHNTTIAIQTVTVPEPPSDPALTPLSLPKNLTAEDVPDDAGGAVLVRWEPTLSQYLDHYELYRHINNFSDYSSLTPTTIPKTSNETIVTDLTNNQTYYFAVVPVTTAGARFPLVYPVSVTPTDDRDLTPPSQVDFSGHGHVASDVFTITINWTQSEDDADFDRYEVYFVSNPGLNIEDLEPDLTKTDINTSTTSLVGPTYNESVYYFVAVVVYDTSDNHMLPFWEQISIYVEPPSTNGNGHENDTAGNGNGDDGLTFRDFIPEMVASTVVGMVGFLFVSWRRGKMKYNLDLIQAIYDKFFDRPTIALEKMSSLRVKMEEDMKKGKLNENQYLIVEKRINEYISILESIIYQDTFRTSDYATGAELYGPPSFPPGLQQPSNLGELEPYPSHIGPHTGVEQNY